jgi:hypothetical protein
MGLATGESFLAHQRGIVTPLFSRISSCYELRAGSLQRFTNAYRLRAYRTSVGGQNGLQPI